MRETVIHTDRLTKRFGNFTAVDHISFDVGRGEIFGFLGANGAGKTTAMRMLCGLSRPTEGSGSVAGYDIATQPEMVKRNIGYMSQRFSLYEDLKVWENLRLFGGIFGPEAVVVSVELFFQLPQHAGRLTHQPAVDGGRSGHLLLRGDLFIGVLTHPRQGALDAPAAKTVDDVLHRNVTRKVPQAFVPLAAQPEMAEDAVEHRV